MRQPTPLLPWLLILLPATAMVVLVLVLSVQTGWRSAIDYLDIIAELVLLGILLKWVQTASVLKRQQRTYWVFLAGNACLVWLMSLKLVEEVSLYNELWFQIAESLFAIAGVVLLSMGIAAWSRDYQALIDDTEAKKNQYKQLSITDALTGLMNRTAYNQRIEQFVSDQQPYLLMLIDLDHFKQINDRYGHDAGDAALKQVGALLGSNSRNQEDCFRVGGEEFAIVLTQCSLSQAESIAERLRTAIETHAIRWQDAELSCTVSIGLCLSQTGESPQTTYRHADAALYEAKQNGRNRVVVSH
ncbi:GGDEF domain-containing protein [Reinekea blandensis]|uniref:diguanylate cyclase n=1 Tax=Reinekea blandensis MED297 TaxID=314283 RepID=A4B9Y3_9GAMM|nr:GGDEF domain-containing protein [Reinekea blandensis]EAR11434.1 diguanylate cyclase (GGDEF domain) [Reinekea sp. MED297] [Reinekea blandensis MED297]